MIPRSGPETVKWLTIQKLQYILERIH
jgi:hypothetical protein